MKVTITTLSLAFAILLLSCFETRSGRGVDYTTEMESVENRQTVFSDDSLVMAYWWDTGNGGTAPDIEARCRFKTEEGKIVEEKRPLLCLIYPDYDYGHREVERIVSIVTPYGQRVYFFICGPK